MSEVNINAAPAGAESEPAKAAPEAGSAALKPALEAFEGFDLAVPEALRSAAEQFVTQSREAYERSRDAMEDTVEMLEESIDMAGQGTAAINRKVIELLQSNVNSGFDLAKELAGAKNVAEIFERQTAFARKQFETFATQAEEIRELSTKVATDTAEPFKAHVTRSMESLKTH
jgi:phasin